MKEKEFHYAWVILIVGCIVNFAGLGTIFNTSGMFFPSVTQDLGIGTGDMALYMTVLCLAMFAGSPLVGKLLPKINIRITMSAAFIIVLLATAAMSLYTEIWQWYLSGAIIGFAGAFIFFIPIPVIIQNWFHKKTGMMLGIAGAFTGLGGAIMNPIIGFFIEATGWRMAYVLTAVIVAIIVLPFTIFALRFKPEEKGMKAYGYKEVSGEQAKTGEINKQSGISVKTAVTSLSFSFVVIIAASVGLISGFNQLLNTYGASIGLSATLAATLVSASMISNMVTKLLYGAASDIFGVKATLIVSALLIALGFGLFFLSDGAYATVLIASILYGIHGPTIVVGLPLVTKQLFGTRHYTEIYSYVSMSQNFIKAFGFAIFGYIYQITNSYEPAFILGFVICLLIAILTFGAFKAGKNLKLQNAA